MQQLMYRVNTATIMFAMSSCWVSGAAFFTTDRKDKTSKERLITYTFNLFPMFYCNKTNSTF